MPPITELTRSEPIHLEGLEDQGIFMTGRPVFLAIELEPIAVSSPGRPAGSGSRRRATS